MKKDEMPLYRTELRLIGPEDAKEILTKHFDKNRRIYKAVVDKYCDNIKKGTWSPYASEAISISDTGKLLNGQHRLTAIAKSEEYVWVEFRYGVPESEYVYFDQGKNRSAADLIGAKSNTSVSALTGAMLLMSSFEDISYRSFNTGGQGKTGILGATNVAMYYEAFESKYPGYIADAVNFSKKTKIADTKWNGTGIALVHVALHVMSQDILCEFETATESDADPRKSVIAFKSWMRRIGRPQHNLKGAKDRYWCWCAACKVVSVINGAPDAGFKYQEKDGKPNGNLHMPGFEPWMLRM